MLIKFLYDQLYEGVHRLYGDLVGLLLIGFVNDLQKLLEYNHSRNGKVSENVILADGLLDSEHDRIQNGLIKN